MQPGDRRGIFRKPAIRHRHGQHGIAAVQVVGKVLPAVELFQLHAVIINDTVRRNLTILVEQK
ncbi:hypothetical protein SDC9_74003 [bioreactor metagenome]|uniref:Uncharacterized protein n=1 Tax=bioreactor metagenome TaxID=1076179 RepID=A0A644YFW2_9ZZZZ